VSRALAPALALALLLSGCDRRKGGAADMKPAEDWGAVAVDPDDPHAGVPMNDPHGRGGMPMDEAHAGVPQDDPHAGMDMTGPGGLPPPDPDRPIDPNKFVKGTIKLGDGVKAPAAGTIYLSVRPADAQGNAAGPPLAVLDLPTAVPASFSVTGADAMIGGTEFAGRVLVRVFWDQDGDVDTKQPGDLLGTALGTIPAEGLEVVLDTVQP
jgi:hypothetical protein